ncbi:MAG: hypothetical protein ACP5I8_10785 [Phycisphaerae bacterium]
MDSAVKAFSRLVDGIRPDVPPTERQYEEGRKLLLKIAAIIDFDHYSDPDAFVAGKRIRRLVGNRMPAWVRDLRFDTGQDVSGDPALRIWVIADDKALPPGKLREQTSIMRHILQDCVGSDYWPYIRFQNTTEQASLAGGLR